MSAQLPNPESYPFMMQDHERRLQTLEREKLATEVALIKRDVADMKVDVATIKTNQTTLMDERGQRTGGRGVVRNALTIGLVSLVLVLGLILQFLSYVNSI
jgi:hypothetical protein